MVEEILKLGEECGKWERWLCESGLADIQSLYEERTGSASGLMYNVCKDESRCHL